MLLLVLLPVVGWAQRLIINQTTDDSIQYLFSDASGSFRPIVKDGKVTWSFNRWIYKTVDYWREMDYEQEVLSIDNVKDIRILDNDTEEVRKALSELYQTMNGEKWNNKENWCSDKPFNEWYGIGTTYEGRVHQLWLNNNNLKGKIPECLTRIGPIQELSLGGCEIGGEIPDFVGKMYDLRILNLYHDGFSGAIPESISLLPELKHLALNNNNFEGALPESFIVNLMDRLEPQQFFLDENHFSGKVPEKIRNHERFAWDWPFIIIQNGGMDFSDLNIPALSHSLVDMKGNTVNLGEIYKRNKYTVLFYGNYGGSISGKLIKAYNAYKDMGFDVVGMQPIGGNFSDYMSHNDIPWNYHFLQEDNRPDYDLISWIFPFFCTPQIHLIDQNGNIIFTTFTDDKGNPTYSNPGERGEKLFDVLGDLLGKVDYDYYTSTDYSHDGEVVTLQKATTGQGFDLVFVGEGFTDKDLEEGRFDQRMSEALEQFFAYEPYTSLRERFNVYAVKAVSPNAEFIDGCTHAIDGDYSKALEYASKVTDLNPDRPMRVTVVYKNASGGRSYCMMMEDDSFVCFAMDGVSTILNHEAGGHGIGKLFDEYVEEDDNYLTTMPDDKKTELDNIWTTQGWGANVDWRSDPKEVKWAKFINDARYADEKIGVYEGSYLYLYGVYRPTDNSMMRYNNIGFNAPSREEIYKRVMKESEGDGWTYDYETFVAFDATGHSQFVNSLANASGTRGIGAEESQRSILTAPPVFLKGTWRDALKKNKK